MKKTIFIFFMFVCFFISNVSAQNNGRRLSNYKSLISTSADVTLKDNSNFRSREIKLGASEIEDEARLIRLQFDQQKYLLLPTWILGDSF